MEQRVGRIGRVNSKISRQLEEYNKNSVAPHSEESPKLTVFTPFIKNTIDEDIFDLLKEREKWFN